MATVKIVSLDGAKNQKVQYPVVGVLEHDSNGIAEVDEEKVEALLLSRKDHLMLESEYKQFIAENNKNKHKKTMPSNHKSSQGEGLDLEAEEEDSDTENSGKQETVTADEFRNSIMGQTKISLQAMCEDESYPTAEWKDLKKTDLVDYLVKKTEK